MADEASAATAPPRATSRQQSNLRKRKAPGDQSAQQQGNTEHKHSKRPKIHAKPSSAKTPAHRGAIKKQPARKNQPRDAARKEAGVNPDIGQMDAQLMADHLGRSTKRFEPKLSMVELEDRRVPESAILDTTSWAKDRNLASVATFLEQFSPASSSKDHPRASGAPRTVIVAASGIRAADLTRAVRNYRSEGLAVLKLFAKHIKLKEAITSTKSTRANIAVGTPQRIFDLINQGALSLDRLERIVVDASSINDKQRGILDMPETATALSKLLSRDDLKARYQSESTHLLFY